MSNTTLRTRRIPYYPRGAPSVLSHSGDTTSGSSIVIAKPAGTASGDVLVSYASTGGNTGSNDAGNIPAPSGWTKVFGSVDASALFYRVCDGTEPASYTWTVGTHTGVFIVNIARVTGADTSAPINNWSKDEQSAVATSSTAASLTAPSPNMLLLHLFNVANSSTLRVCTPPAGCTKQWEELTATVSRQIDGGISTVGPGATGAQTWNTSAAYQQRLVCVLMPRKP